MKSKIKINLETIPEGCPDGASFKITKIIGDISVTAFGKWYGAGTRVNEATAKRLVETYEVTTVPCRS